MTTTAYIDQTAEVTTEQAIALATGAAKPYPASWFYSGYETLESRNDALDAEYEELLAIAASGNADELDCNWYEEFVCPLNRWEALYCNR